MKRLTTLLLALTGVTTIGCVSTVGGDECTSERCADDDEGSGSATARDCDGEDVEVLKKDLVIESDSSFSKLPKGCWGLDGTLRIQGSAVTSLAKLGDLVDVNNLEIASSELTTFDTLQRVNVYGRVRVTGNAKLTSLDNLTAVKWTGNPLSGDTTRTFTIVDNAELTNVNGLKYLQSTEGDLQIERNPKLAAIDLLELHTINGSLFIKENGATSVKLSMLKNVTNIEVTSNPQLATFSGLAAANILGNITFRGNAKLLSIGSMSSLNLIGGNLIIDDNDQLSDLIGLTSSLQRIAGQVSVSNNQVLNNLGQLSRLSLGIGLTVTVTNNPVLGYCKAFEIDRCVNSGTVTNTGNGPQQSCTTWCP
ncbi:MAG: hypothetical protein ACKV2T_41395 [Kofleriaceae bacterium]